MARRKGEETSFATNFFPTSIHKVAERAERSKLGVQFLSRD